jgi:cytochrome c oxidase assembly protein subunit 15
MTRFQKLALAAALITFVLIGIGGFVRAAGAGLGCPDWPRCFDRWIPPTEASQLPPHIDPALFNFEKAWIEYCNRLVGVFTGFLILATALIAWRDHRRQPAILRPALLALALVALQGWLGGLVVRYHLDPRFVTLHLALALVLLGVLILAYLNSRSAPDPRLPSPLASWAWGLIGLAALQMLLGALVRGSIDLAVEANPTLPRGLLLEQVGWLDPVHRNLALLVLLACALLAWKARTPFPRLAWLPLGLALGQFGAGLGLAYLALPPFLQLLHVFLGCAFLGALLVLALLPARS